MESEMQQNKISILSTSSLNPALLQEAAKENVFIDELSFIDVLPINHPDVNKLIQNFAVTNKVVVFTSQNAVEVVANSLQYQKTDWTIYCIGNTTKELVQKYFGAQSIAGVAEDASELAKVILANQVKEVIFFCGDKRRDELPEILKGKDVQVNELIVYQTIITPHLLEKDYDGILFFSPSAVESFFKMNSIKEQTVLFAIGKTTANTIKQNTNNTIIISNKPGKANLFKKMMNYYK